MRANLNHTQQRPFGEGQLLQSLVVTAVTIHNQLRDGGGQFHQLSLLVDIRVGIAVRHGWMVSQSANVYSSIPLPSHHYSLSGAFALKRHQATEQHLLEKACLLNVLHRKNHFQE